MIYIIFVLLRDDVEQKHIGRVNYKLSRERVQWKNSRHFRTAEVKRHGPCSSVIVDSPLKTAAVAFKLPLSPQKQVPVLGGAVSEVICTLPTEHWLSIQASPNYHSFQHAENKQA